MAQISSSTLSVSSSGYGSGSFTYRIRVVENSYSIVNNNGSYTIYFDVMPVKSRYDGWSDTDATFRISTSNGQTINADSSSGIRNSKSAMTYNSYTTIGSWTGTLNHADDGSLTINTSITYGWNSGTASYLPLTATISNSATATVIPRYSEIACNSPVAMASTQTITVTQKSTGFSHILYYKTSSGSYTEIGRKTGALTNTYSWTVLDSSNSLPNTDRDTYTLLARTYLTTNYTGEYLDTTFNIVATVPSSYVPSVSIGTISEGNSSIPSGFPFIVGYSTVKVPLTFTGSHNSTVKSRSATLNGETQSSTATTNPVTLTFTKALTGTSNTLSASTTDSRGRTGSASRTITATAYSAPSVTVDCTRANSSGTADALGTYVSVKCKWSWTSIKPSSSELNSATIKVYVGGTLKTTYTASSNNQTSNVQVVLLSGMATTSQYTITVVIADKITSATVVQVVTKATLSLSLFDNGTNMGVAMGRMATSDGVHIYLNQHGYSGYKFIFHKSDGSTVEHDLAKLMFND